MLNKIPLIFTDLDGTLLDARNYSFEPARDMLRSVKELGVPLIICTSKTRAEVMIWRARLGNDHPFIVENGGGVYIPSGYFGFPVPYARNVDSYSAVVFGTPYRELREALAVLKSRGFDVRGFGDMTVEKVAELTGLDINEAALAKEREFDEPFVYAGNKEALACLVEEIGLLGFKHTSGRLMHILGDNDKGRAVRHLTGLYRKRYGGVVTAAIGDSPNDEPMLAAVDHPFLVRKPEGLHDPAITDGRVTKVDGIGPEGWAEAVGLLLGRLQSV